MSAKKHIFFVLLFCLVLVNGFFIGCPSGDDDDDNNNDNNDTAAYGALSINSDPQGAYVYLDSEGTGRTTPTLIENIPVGIHSVRLTLAGYHDWQGQVTISENQTYEVFVPMTPDTQPTPTATPQNPTPTPTQDSNQKPNLHAISINVSGTTITGFTWENNSSITITKQFLNIVYANIEEPPYYAWAFTVQPPVTPGVYTTSCNIAIPAITHTLCLFVDTEDDIDESNEAFDDNVYYQSYP